MPSARVFTRPDGSELRAHHVHAAWQTARAKVGLADAHMHDLRHAGLTLATQSGATLAEVMRRAGHSTQRAAMIYQHAAEDRDREVARRLSESVGGASLGHAEGTPRSTRLDVDRPKIGSYRLQAHRLRAFSGGRGIRTHEDASAP